MDNALPSNAPLPTSYLRRLVILAVLFLLGSAVFAVLVLQKLERAVLVTESVNAKLDRVADAMAPVGRAAIGKSMEALENVDAEDLGKSAKEGVKKIGKAATDKATQWIKKKPTETQEPE